MARLTASGSEKLRQNLLAAINTGAAVSQTATEWHQSGFQKYTRAQVKRQLVALGRAKKIKVYRGYPGTCYAPLD
jgi:Holliday junction resolvasome RuvABC endonuclease subunit